MTARRRAVAASLGVLGAVLAGMPARAAGDSSGGGCGLWNGPALARYAETADRLLNRGKDGTPILYPLHLAAWNMQRHRWADAAYDLIGAGHRFSDQPPEVPAVVRQIDAVLHRCGDRLGIDYSQHVMPGAGRTRPLDPLKG